MEADNLQTARPTLRAWVDEYAAIERECFEELAKSGIDFAPADRYDAETREAKRRLRDKGATFRNGDASISTGALSSACVACTGDLRSKTFVLSLQCNRDCYFCFNVNQGDGERCPLNEAWRSDVDEFDAACGGLTHAGLTGGEPLLHREEAVEFDVTCATSAPTRTCASTPPGTSSTKRRWRSCATRGSTSCA